MNRSIRFVMASLVVVILVFGIVLGSRPDSSAASASSFSSAEAAIQSAFATVNRAEQGGSNVTGLIIELNNALTYMQRAQSENASNPSQASADLQSASQIAQQVVAQSSSVSQQGVAAKQRQMAESLGVSAFIVVIAVVLYIYGGRIYRWVWCFFLYRNYVVKPSDG